MSKFVTLRPTIKQHAAWQLWLDKATRFLLYGGGAGGGKSWWMCEVLLSQAYQYPGIKSFIARKELKRLMASTYVTWTKVCAYHHIPREDWRLNGQYNYIEFTNGSRIDLLDCSEVPSDPMFQRFGSLEYTNGFMEEAGEISFGAFDVLKSRVGRHKNDEFDLLPKIGLTCNPDKGWLYRVFYRPSKDLKIGLPIGYAFIQSLFGDNPHTAETYGQQLAEISDKAQRERLMYGNWEYDDDPASLVKYEAILDLFTNTVDAGEKYMICDVARYGNDTTRIGVYEGLDLKRVITRSKQGTHETISDLRTLAQEERIPYSHILADEDGVGGGVVDGLPGIRGFVANSTAFPQRDGSPSNYRNLKSQCSYALADAINERRYAVSAEITSNDQQDIIDDLGWIKSKDADKDQKRQVLPKEEIKEHLGRSPDLGDMMMMRMFFEVAPQLTAPSTVTVRYPSWITTKNAPRKL